MIFLQIEKLSYLLLHLHRNNPMLGHCQIRRKLKFYIYYYILHIMYCYIICCMYYDTEV